MYKYVTKVRCNVCQYEEELKVSGCCRQANLDLLCETNGWAYVHDANDVVHICPRCIKTVGYAHGMNLARVALQKFDPGVYSNACELIWRVGDKYLSFNDLVDLMYFKEDTCERSNNS